MKTKSSISIVFVVLFVLVAAAPAEAQRTRVVQTYGGRPVIPTGDYLGRNRGYFGGGYYDPALLPFIQQMMSLPNGLVACEIDFATGKARSCRFLIKEMGLLEAYLRDMNGSVPGTIGTRNNKPCFKPFSDDDFRIGTGTGGALGAGGGALIGSIGGRKGAAIGAVGGAILGGVLGSRNSRGNCLEITGGLPSNEASGQLAGREEATIAHSSDEEIAKAIALYEGRKASAETTMIVRNRFEEATVRIYNGGTKILELASGAEGRIEVSTSAKIWGEAYLKNPLNGNKPEWTPLELGAGINELPQGAGWVFGNPGTHPDIRR